MITENKTIFHCLRFPWRSSSIVRKLMHPGRNALKLLDGNMPFFTSRYKRICKNNAEC